MKNQLQFNFDAPDSGSQPAVPTGFDAWRQERASQLRAMADKLGLPLGHPVEVTLSSGPVLRGVLRLADERLWIENEKRSKAIQLILRVGKAEFPASEVESCCRTD